MNDKPSESEYRFNRCAVSARTIITRIDELNAKRTDLYGQLKASLAIIELWPQAFSWGPVTLSIQGSHSHGFKLCMCTHVEVKSFPLSEIPLELACRDNIKKALKAIVNARCGESQSKKDAEALLSEIWKIGG